MDIKRWVSGLILFPILVIVLVFGNKYIFDVIVALLAIMSIHEFYKAFRTGQKANPICWIGYVAAALISIIHIIPEGLWLKSIGVTLPISLCILFLTVIAKKLKVNLIDISVTFFGIFYIVIFLMYIPIIREDLPNGEILIWFLVLAAVATDTFAYLVGRHFGKHHFTEISPKKTIEGSIGGIIGAIVVCLIFNLICQTAFNVSYNYLSVALITIILSILSQVGDLSASCIKRFTGIKDFSNLIPGHGGMLDRIDSIVFTAPFAYFLFMLLI